MSNYIKEQNKIIDIIFDIHRDSYNGKKLENNSIRINSKDVANLRFVIAVGHENWENNLKWAIKIQKKADEMYPGLFKPIYIYSNKYNQDISKYATLIEVGNEENTIEEAENSMIYLSEAIERAIKE